MTFSPYAQALVALVLAAAFAGCVQEGEPKTQGPQLPVFDDKTGAVRGQVLTEEEMPIAEAEVGLLAQPITTKTDASGNFVLNSVPPGEHEVGVVALGYEPATRRVTVKAGEATDLIMFQLIPLPADIPYHKTLLSRVELTGVMWKVTPTCIYTSVNPLVKTCGGVRQTCPPQEEDPCEQHTMEPQFEGFNSEWQSIVGEVFWTPQSGATGKGFHFDINAPNITRGTGGSINQADPYTFKKSSNKAPIVIRIDKDALAARGVKESDWNNPTNPESCMANLDQDEELEERNNCDWFFRLFPAAYDLGIGEDGFGPDYGVSYQNVADIYFTFFIKEKAEPNFTAIPA